MDKVIETHGLTKIYNGTHAVQDLELQVQRGEVFGMLGPNGSGKTTTILMLLGLTEPTSGSVRVLGFDPARQPLQVKSRVGYMPDSVGFYDDLTARENLSYIARLNRIPSAEARRRIESALERMGLAEQIDRPVGTFSHGMRQRLGLAELLVKKPEMVILDEPTLGLDPGAAREFLDLIRGLKHEGITVLLASHLLHQVQAVCDRVGLFHKGRMVLEGTVRELSQQVLGVGHRLRLEAEGDGIVERLKDLQGLVRLQEQGDHTYILESERDLREDAARAVLDAGGRLLTLRAEEPNLDEVYTHYFQEIAYAS